jgi:hypothetical protein
MAKRTRYPSRTGKSPARRAARPATSTGPARAADSDVHPPYPHEHLADGTVRATSPGTTSTGLTEAEVERAALLEAEATAKERAAIAESLRSRNRAQVEDSTVAGDSDAPLSVRAAHEYAYVSRDVKRIAVTGGLMLGILAVLHLLVNVLEVVSI